MKRECRKLFSLIGDLKVLRALKGLVLLTDIRGFTTLFSVILRCESYELLESSIESDLGMRFAIRSLDLAFHDFAVFEYYFYCKNRLSVLAYFRDSGKTKCLYPLSVIF